MFIYNKLAEMVEGIAQTLDFENALAETGYEPRSLKPSADGMSHEYGNFLQQPSVSKMKLQENCLKRQTKHKERLSQFKQQVSSTKYRMKAA